jgi:hypothetical protein
MLDIRPIMNSQCEEIFEFKTCCGIKVFEQNLEIHVRNVGSTFVVVPSYFDLEGESGVKRIETLMPHGRHRLDPGEIIAFYCYMDEKTWTEGRHMVFYDTAGNPYRVSVTHRDGSRV